jgi:uncharacterized membrane protein YdcZ (DUF606 family)
MAAETNIGTQKFGIACSWIFSVLTAVGWLGIAHFYQPPPADLVLAETHRWFTETYAQRVIVGCTIFYIACGFLVPASIQFGIMLAKIEGKWPLLSITAAVSGIFISLIIFLNACAWIVAAYRPESGPDVVQAWYDWAWMSFLLGWIYLAVEMLATAIVELRDTSDHPMVPHWFAWLTIASVMGVITAAGPAFFKSGVFAYHGRLGFYLPMAVWGVYLNGTAWFMWRHLNKADA